MAREIRIYHDGELRVGGKVELSEFASHHLMTVLRVTPGEEVIVFHGQGGEYLATVQRIEKKRVYLLLEAYRDVCRESPLQIELVQGISRGERMEYAIQKAVELGVSEISPVFTERCGVKLELERLSRRLAQWQAIMIGAAEQSGRTRLPILHTPIPLTHWLASPITSTRLVCAPGADTTDWTPQHGKVSLVIGPEGGLSSHELKAALQAQCQALRLGPRILRTETASVVAITLAQLKAGDFGT